MVVVPMILPAAPPDDTVAAAVNTTTTNPAPTPSSAVTVTGFVSAHVTWDRLLDAAVPSFVTGLDVVISGPETAFTLRLGAAKHWANLGPGAHAATHAASESSICFCVFSRCARSPFSPRRPARW